MVSAEYERALLGAVLRGYPDIRGLSQVVTSGDFYSAAHGAIWDAILRVHASGEKVDALLVMSAMGNDAHRLPGGATYLTELEAPIGGNAPSYAAQVRDDAVRRQIESLGLRCQQMLTDADTDTSDMVSRIKTWAEEVGTIKTSNLIDVSSAMERMIDIAEHGEKATTPSPWRDLNDVIGGWYPNQLIVVGARPGVGKSLVLENAATDVARGGKWVLFVTLEMTATELVQRTMAHTAKVELKKLRNASLDENDWSRVNAAAAEVAGLRVRYAEEGNQTLATIRARAWEVHQEATRNGEELGMVVVDYIQLVETSSDRAMSRQQKLGEVSRGFKKLAKELGVPVLTAAQLNRQSQARANPIPMLADIREAGDIEQDADVVILLHEPEIEDGGRMLKTGDMEMIVAKQRNGPQRTITVQKHGHYARVA